VLDQQRPDREGDGMTDDWLSPIPRRVEGETQERHEARVRFLCRISEWSDPEYLQARRKPMDPVVETRQRIFELPWARPKR